MNYDEAIAYIENSGWSKTRLGLERTRELLGRLGNPEKDLRFIHIAGSNGKGSTAAMLESCLRSAGYRTGLYTSPHLVRFNERISVLGREISDEALASITGMTAHEAELMEDHPSQFELSTAIAFLYFKKMQCDIVVLEVGMGGELDSTNAIDAPEACVITNIGYDHTEYLGDTLEEIAKAKGGIIKKDSGVVVCYDMAPEAYRVIADISHENGVPLRKACFDELEEGTATLTGQLFSYRGKTWMLSLSGRYQIYNAAVVIETLHALSERGWNISDGDIAGGLETVSWAARFELLSSDPVVVLDGGHNPQCAAALKDSLESLFKGRRAVFLTGMLADKDYTESMQILGQAAESFICVTPESHRALGGTVLCDKIRELGFPASACGGLEEGILSLLDESREKGLPAVIFGSLYLAGSVKACFRDILKKWIRKEKLKERDALTDEERLEYSKTACRLIEAEESYKKAGVIMIYCHVGSEICLDSLQEHAFNHGKSLCVPVCGDGGIMDAVRLTKSTVWNKNRYGIPEPVYAESDIVPPESIDLVICPVVSFDKSLMRLGMGGGYYDRFLPKCRNAVRLGAAFYCQRHTDIPAGEHDIRMDIVVTEEGKLSTI